MHQGASPLQESKQPRMKPFSPGESTATHRQQGSPERAGAALAIPRSEVRR